MDQGPNKAHQSASISPLALTSLYQSYTYIYTPVTVEFTHFQTKTLEIETEEEKMQEKKGELASTKSPKKANLLDHNSIKHILDESVTEVCTLSHTCVINLCGFLRFCVFFVNRYARDQFFGGLVAGIDLDSEFFVFVCFFSFFCRRSWLAKDIQKI